MTADPIPPTAVVRVSRGNFDPARFAEVHETTVATRSEDKRNAKGPQAMVQVRDLSDARASTGCPQHHPTSRRRSVTPQTPSLSPRRPTTTRQVTPPISRKPLTPTQLHGDWLQARFRSVGKPTGILSAG
jgi:anti-sigma factor RsiW